MHENEELTDGIEKEQEIRRDGKTKKLRTMTSRSNMMQARTIICLPGGMTLMKNASSRKAQLACVPNWDQVTGQKGVRERAG